MSVTSVTELKSPRSATKERDSRSATRTYLVKTSSASDSPVVVLAAGSLPSIGDQHPDDAWLRVTRLDSPEPIGDTGTAWHVTVQYETRKASTDSADPVDDPLAEPPEITVEPSDDTYQLDRDADGRWFENSVGEPFEGLVVDAPDVVITIERNEPNFSVPTVAAFRNALNSSTFWGQAAGFWKIKSISARSMRTGDTFYVRVRYVVEGRRFSGPSYLQVSSAERSYTLLTTTPGWYHRQVNMSNLVKRDDVLVKPIDGRGREIDGPVRISLAGAQLADTAAPVYLAFKPFPSRDYAPLLLPEMNISEIPGL